MAKLKLLLLSLVGIIGVGWGQCDLELIGFDTETFDLTIAVNNGYGCNNPNSPDYDPTDDGIYDLVIGIRSITAGEPYPCFWNQGDPTSPSYGWALLNFPISLPNALYDIGEGPDNQLTTGEIITVNLSEASNGGFATQESCLAEAFANGYFDDCSQIVIWQINDSNGSDFWNGYFESGVWGEGNNFPYPEFWDEAIDCIPGDPDWSAICNNQLTFSTSDLCGGDPPPPLPEGCMDPEAYNYNPEAVLNDNSCEYIDLNMGLTITDYDCDPATNIWSFTSTLNIKNDGDIPVDYWCIQVIFDDNTEEPAYDQCYPITINPGETYPLFIPALIPSDLGYNLPLYSIEYIIYGVEGETLTGNNTQYIDETGIIYWDCLVGGCTDEIACNYDPLATAGNPLIECNYPDECGVCEGEETGPGAIYDCGCDPLPFPDACDCEGNMPIDLYQCDCEGTPDLDQDGICDGEDDCVGYYDACGVCNGPGAIYECGCFDISEGDCDCLGNVLDACGICGGTGTDIDGDGLCDDEDPCIGVYDDCGVCNGDNSTCSGCIDPSADNYDPTVWIDDGSCIYCTTNIWIPNAVTPNNDGVNDVWKIVTDYPDCWQTWRTWIYNRWGQLMWYSEDITEPWVINVQGGQYYASDGVYTYKIEGVTWGLTDFVWNQTGHITVIR